MKLNECWNHVAKFVENRKAYVDRSILDRCRLHLIWL